MSTNEAKSIQTRQPKSAADTLRDLLIANTKGISSMVPEHLTPERLMRVAVNCVSKTPALQKCTPSSLLSCVMAAAEVGLEPGGVLGQFYLVPFGDVATPIIGYRGLLELARRTGEIASVRAVVVYEKDTFKITEGIEQTIIHERYLGDGGAGQLKYAYAVAKLKDGTVHVEVMTRAQIDAIRARSRSGNNGPWVTDYDEMAKKTVFRRLAKWLPLSSERFQKAIERDDSDYIEGEAAAEAVTSELSNVKERIGKKVHRLPIQDVPALQMPADEAPQQPEPPADSTN